MLVLDTAGGVDLQAEPMGAGYENTKQTNESQLSKKGFHFKLNC